MGTTEMKYDTASELGSSQRDADACTTSKNRCFTQNFLLAMDLIIFFISALFAWWTRFIVWSSGTWPWVPNHDARFEDHFAFLALYGVLFVLFAYARKLYVRPWSKEASSEIADVIKAAGSAAVIVTSAIYISGQKFISREVVAATFVLSTTSVIGWRWLLRRGLSGVVEQRNVVIVGAGRVGHALRDYLETNPNVGMVVKGFVDRRLCGRYSDPVDACGGVQFLGNVSEVECITRTYFIDEVLITLPADRELVKDVALQAKRAGVDVRVVPDLYDGMAFGAPIEFVGQFPTMPLYQQPIPALQLVLKRSIDVIASTIALLLLGPLFGLVALVIKLDSRGPVLYKSTRVGKKGEFFTCYKFRTMVVDAENRKRELTDMNERDGVLFKISNDPRITRLGRILRKFSIDELPQLWNVLKGDMSLVGPRPPVPGEYSQYEMEHLRRLEVVPGITGLWQVEARQSPRFEDYINLDLHYVENWSLRMDLNLLLKTIWVVLAGTGQ